MAERLRVWLAGGHECDLDLGDGSARELMEKIENAGDRSWFRRTMDVLVYARARSSGLRSKASRKHRATPSSGEAIESARRDSRAQDSFALAGVATQSGGAETRDRIVPPTLLRSCCSRLVSDAAIDGQRGAGSGVREQPGRSEYTLLLCGSRRPSSRHCGTESCSRAERPTTRAS
jgi:hypothetical protein